MALKQIKTGATVSTIVWGTSSILGTNVPAGAIVDSLQLTPKNGEPIEIEDNDGLTAVEVILRDGFNAKAAVLYDAGKAWPVEGANCTLAINWNGASANAIPFGEAPGANGGSSTYANGVVTYTCLVCSVSPAYTKKKEAMVDFNLSYRPNVAV